MGTCGKKELENGARNLNKKARRNTTCTRPWHESPCSRFAGPTAHFCVALQQLCTEKGIRSDLDLRWMERGAARHGQEASELRYSVTYVAGQWRNWRLQLQQARAISGTGSVEKGEGLT